MKELPERLSNVLLILNPKKEIPVDIIKRITEKLIVRSCSVYAFDNVRFMFAETGFDEKVSFIPSSEVPDDIDFAIILGGDGSMIRSAAFLSEKDVPFVGVNFGRVGYLAELEACDEGLIDRILDGKFVIDSRLMLDVKIIRNDETIKISSPVLNDAVLSNGPVASLLTFDVLCNGTKLRMYRADGVIIATPTGSTAYSMSAGGPILDPALDAVCLTPICPHALGVRPVVLNGNSIIELCNIKSRKNSVFLTPDGRGALEIFPDDRIVISKSNRKTKLIRLNNDGFLGTLRNKLSEAERM